MLRRRLAQAAIIAFPAITCLDIALGLEHWPFGNYPMYSLLYTGQLGALRLYGVTTEGEIAMRSDDQFPPFDQARLLMSLGRLAGDRNTTRELPDALRNLMKLYQQTHHTGPSLRGLRLYSVSWHLQDNLTGNEAPETRTLIASTTD